LWITGTRTNGFPKLYFSSLLECFKNIVIEITGLGLLTMEFIAQLEGGFSRLHTSQVQAGTNILLGYFRIYRVRDSETT
jgi:hypothetical protein